MPVAVKRRAVTALAVVCFGVAAWLGASAFGGGVRETHYDGPAVQPVQVHDDGGKVFEV